MSLGFAGGRLSSLSPDDFTTPEYASGTVRPVSIVAMMAEAAQELGTPHTRTRGRTGLRTRGRKPAGNQTGAAAVASELLTYLPTEAVALYTGILPFLLPKASKTASQPSYTGRWILAGGVAVAAVLWGVGIFRREVLARKQTFRWPIRRTAIILIAYTGWVFVIPGSPCNAFGWYSPSLGAIIGIAANALIGLGILWFGPPEEP